MLTAESLSDLAFSTVFPGISKSVSRTSSNAASFYINGTPPREISVSLTLPTVLTSGGNQLPISFSSTDGGYNLLPIQATATAFNPYSAVVIHLAPPAGKFYLWLGGTVSPSVMQPAGSYTGTITLTSFYTGN